MFWQDSMQKTCNFSVYCASFQKVIIFNSIFAAAHPDSTRHAAIRRMWGCFTILYTHRGVIFLMLAILRRCVLGNCQRKNVWQCFFACEYNKTGVLIKTGMAIPEIWKRSITWIRPWHWIPKRVFCMVFRCRARLGIMGGYGDLTNTTERKMELIVVSTVIPAKEGRLVQICSHADEGKIRDMCACACQSLA